MESFLVDSEDFSMADILDLRGMSLLDQQPQEREVQLPSRIHSHHDALAIEHQRQIEESCRKSKPQNNSTSGTGSDNKRQGRRSLPPNLDHIMELLPSDPPRLKKEGRRSLPPMSDQTLQNLFPENELDVQFQQDLWDRATGQHQSTKKMEPEDDESEAESICGSASFYATDILDEKPRAGPAGISLDGTGIGSIYPARSREKLVSEKSGKDKDSPRTSFTRRGANKAATSIYDLAKPGVPNLDPTRSLAQGFDEEPGAFRVTEDGQTEPGCSDRVSRKDKGGKSSLSSSYRLTPAPQAASSDNDTRSSDDEDDQKMGAVAVEAEIVPTTESQSAPQVAKPVLHSNRSSTTGSQLQSDLGVVDTPEASSISNSTLDNAPPGAEQIHSAPDGEEAPLLTQNGPDMSLLLQHCEFPLDRMLPHLFPYHASIGGVDVSPPSATTTTPPPTAVKRKKFRLFSCFRRLRKRRRKSKGDSLQEPKQDTCPSVAYVRTTSNPDEVSTMTPLDYLSRRTATGDEATKKLERRDWQLLERIQNGAIGIGTSPELIHILLDGIVTACVAMKSSDKKKKKAPAVAMDPTGYDEAHGVLIQSQNAVGWDKFLSGQGIACEWTVLQQQHLSNDGGAPSNDGMAASWEDTMRNILVLNYTLWMNAA
ncbi:expressed unknown protein [Seminavis robusta]|uniref:Uncharacterized protein n=1 Tax=Seminavis robusta TaxID=568900 RepID=A0A9N8HJ90_9STRA|nr:expressed unknown protein [Seminavis robusta]|eukprot:Sro645_g180590.1 n/a (652) ;mRNA; r:11710-13665